MTSNPYDGTFYDNQSGGSRRSAQIVAPMIVDLLQPSSVLDVGCGIGTWCEAFRDAGVEQTYGVDGPWVDADRLLIPTDHFTTFDFSAAPTPYAPPLSRQKFDLAISLEMFEHLDPAKAEHLVEFMTRSAGTVIMGAALPGQGGIHHVNEQWPAYWAKLFSDRGYRAYDLIRPLIWNLNVQPWYAQNVVVYHSQPLPEAAVQRAQRAALAQLEAPASLVHPGMFTRIANKQPSLKKAMKAWIANRVGGQRATPAP